MLESAAIRKVLLDQNIPISVSGWLKERLPKWKVYHVNELGFQGKSLDISSCGKDILQAKKNPIEAIEINIEETRRMGTLAQFFEQCGIEETADDLMSSRKELVGFTPIEVAV